MAKKSDPNENADGTQNANDTENVNGPGNVNGTENHTVPETTAPVNSTEAPTAQYTAAPAPTAQYTAAQAPVEPRRRIAAPSGWLVLGLSVAVALLVGGIAGAAIGAGIASSQPTTFRQVGNDRPGQEGLQGPGRNAGPGVGTENGPLGQGRGSGTRKGEAPTAPQAGSSVTGTIASIDGDTITLTTAAGDTVTVTTTDSTRVVATGDGDLAKGDRIIVRGERSGDTITATAIRRTGTGS